MVVKLSQELIDGIWKAMRQTNRKSGGDVSAEHFAKHVDEGWIPLRKIEDVICALDSRIDEVFYQFGLDKAVIEFGYTPQFIFPRPNSEDKDEAWSLGKEISASEAVAFFVSLHALGFEIDPKPFALATYQSMKAKKRLTRSELLVLHYVRKQLKSGIMLQSTGERQSVGDVEIRKTGLGQAVEAFVWETGTVFHLTVSGRPKAMRRAI